MNNWSTMHFTLILEVLLLIGAVALPSVCGAEIQTRDKYSLFGPNRARAVRSNGDDYNDGYNDERFWKHKYKYRREEKTTTTTTTTTLSPPTTPPTLTPPTPPPPTPPTPPPPTPPPPTPPTPPPPTPPAPTPPPPTPAPATRLSSDEDDYDEDYDDGDEEDEDDEDDFGSKRGFEYGGFEDDEIYSLDDYDGDNEAIAYKKRIQPNRLAFEYELDTDVAPEKWKPSPRAQPYAWRANQMRRRRLQRKQRLKLQRNRNNHGQRALHTNRNHAENRRRSLQAQDNEALFKDDCRSRRRRSRLRPVLRNEKQIGQKRNVPNRRRRRRIVRAPTETN